MHHQINTIARRMIKQKNVNNKNGEPNIYHTLVVEVVEHFSYPQTKTRKYNNTGAIQLITINI